MRGYPSALVLAILAWSASAVAQSSDESPAKELSPNPLEDLSLEKLLELRVVTATKNAQGVEDAPSVISVITEAQIRAYGYRSIGEALSHEPGIYVRDDLIHPNVGMRGIDPGPRAWSRDLKVMINGQPVSDRGDTSNWLGPELIPIDSVAQIEVIRGPGSALYGANAFLGVVNVITKSPSGREWGMLSVGAGGMQQPCSDERVSGIDVCSRNAASFQPATELAFRVGRSLETPGHTHVEFSVAGQMGQSNRSGLLLPETSPHFAETGPRYSRNVDNLASSRDIEKYRTVFAYVQASKRQWGQLRLETDYSEFARSGEFTDWSVLTHDNVVAQRNWYVRAQYVKDFDELRSNLTLNFATAKGGTTGDNHLRTDPTSGFWIKKVGGYTGYDASAEIRYDIWKGNFLILNGNLSVDDHALPSIYTVQNVAGRSVQRPSYVLGDKTFTNAGAFAQLLLAPFDGLSTIAGLSYDYHNIYGRECSLSSCPQLNSRLGAVYAITKDRSIYAKALFGTSFKAPSAELIYGTPYVTSGIIGNPDLRPETARTFELALGIKPLKAFDILVTGFSTVVGNKVEYIQSGYFTRAENASSLKSLGAELSAAVQLERFSAYTNVSWQYTTAYQCRLRDSDVCAQLMEFNYSYPDLLANAGAHYRIDPAKLVVALNANFVGARWASQSNRLERLPSASGAGYDFKAYQIPKRVLFDLTLSTHDFKPFEPIETIVTLSVRNLLNQQIVEPGFGGIDIPGLGRTIFVNFKQQL